MADRYPLNTKCSHPECSEAAADPHHCFPRSQIIGDSWFVEVLYPTPLEKDITYGHPVVLPDGTETVAEVIPHVTGLCRKHHEDVEIHKAWIKLEDGEFRWYDRDPAIWHDTNIGEELDQEMDTWNLLGPLNPQPGSREGRPKRKKFQGEARRKRKTISIKVPADAKEDGAGIYQDALEAAENAIGYGESPRPAYFTIVDSLWYVALNEGTTDGGGE